MAPKGAKVETRRPGGSGIQGPKLGARDRSLTKGSAPSVAVLDQKAKDVAIVPDPNLAQAAPRLVALQNAELSLTSPPVARHRLRLCFEYAANPAEASLHYVLLVPKLRTQVDGNLRCSDHKWRIEGSTLRGKPVATFEFEHFVLANVPFSMLPNLLVEHEFTSHNPRLQLSCGGETILGPVLELPQSERLAALSDMPHRAEKFRSLLEKHGLARREDERDVAYALRLGEALQGSFAHGADAVEETDDWLHLLPTLILERSRGDSRAFSAAFVYALRAFGVPARLSLGLRFCGKAVGCLWHEPSTEAQSEFFAEGIGWVPVDICQASLTLLLPDVDSAPCSHFVAWHSATPSRAEARDTAKVMRAASCDLDGALSRIHKVCERKGIKPGKKISVSELAAVVGPALQLEAAAAEKCVAEVLTFNRQSGNEGAAFADGYAALELGTCPVHLGAGKGPCATGLAGVAFFEGGPYEPDVPLDIEALTEIRLLLRNFIRQGGETSQVMTWRQRLDVKAALWVDYDYEELPLVPKT